MEIKKVAPTTSLPAQVVNTYNTSNTDTYSCDYINGLHNFSTTEEVIGTWLGKPHYRKVIHSGQLSLSSTLTAISAGLSNIDVVTDIRFTLYFQNNIWFTFWNLDEIHYKKSTDKIELATSSSATFSDSYIIIEYTKTTDNTNTRSIQENEEELVEDKK